MKEVLEDGLRTGLAAGMVSAAAVMVCGAAERGDAFEPMNAVSHMVHGDSVEVRRGFVPYQTMPGLTGHFAAILGWGVLFQWLLRKSRWPCGFAAVLFTGAAWIVDYRLVPPRYTPGFEKVLSRRSVALIYASLCAGLILGSGNRASRG